MGLVKKLVAELVGTAWLVLGGCGAAVFAAGYPELGIGFLGVSLAFGLTVLTGAYALGSISGAHFNPAVTLGLVAGGRFGAKLAIPYIIAQVLGGLLGAWIIFEIASGREGFDVTKGFASNGFGERSPGGYNMHAVFLAEAVLTFFFVLIILHVTKESIYNAVAPIPIGLTLALIHLISIPISNTSVNPARSTSQAWFEGPAAMDQLWLFWAAPIVGAIVAGLLVRFFCDRCCNKSGCGCA